MESLLSRLPETCLVLPSPSDDLLRLSEDWCRDQESILEDLLFSMETVDVPLTVSKGVRQAFPWLTGHSLDPYEAGMSRGPLRHYRVMLVGKAPTMSDVQAGQFFSRGHRKTLLQFLDEAGIAENGRKDFYLTNLLKTPPLQHGKFKQAWVKAQELIIQLEVLMVRPEIIVGFGKEVCKWFLNTNQSLSSLEHRWFTRQWDLKDWAADPDAAEPIEFKFLPCISLLALEYEQRQSDTVRISRTFQMLRQEMDGVAETSFEDSIKYPVIRDIESLERICRKMAKPAHRRLVAVDAEWQGDHPQNKGSYLRCVQFCWAPGKAFVLHLTDTSGKPDFVGSDGNKDEAAQQEAFRLIERTFAEHDLRVCGYYFQADLEWMAYYGLKLEPFYEAAETPEEARDKGGFAVELAVAAYDELAINELDAVRVRFTDYPSYSHILNNHKQLAKAGDPTVLGDLAKRNDWQEIVNNGYGWIPDEILYPYAAADVDVTLRAAIRLERHLDADENGQNCWRQYWSSLSASLVAAEIMQTGLPFDAKQCGRLAVVYNRVYGELLAKLRKTLNWPDFNIASWPQTLQAMYGTKYGGKMDELGRRVSTRPPRALTFALVPVLTNDAKSPKPWSEIVAQNQEHLHSPGTNYKTLGVIMNDPDGVAVRRYNPQTRRFEVVRVKEIPGLELIRDLRTVGQLRSNYTGKFFRLPDGKWMIEGGLLPSVCDDGYIRPFVSQAKETGRWSLSRPNLQAIPKRKEVRYKDILGDRYIGPIRSMFRAPPGYCLLECDYKTAELFMLAVASGDDTLWEHCQRSLLPEDHPDYVDVHSTVAVNGFHLQCAPKKSALSELGKGYLRDVAKCYAQGTMIATPEGWFPIEQIVGLTTYRDVDGRVVVPEKQRSFEINSGFMDYADPCVGAQECGLKPCYEIRSRLGLTLRVTEEHKTFVLRSGWLEKVPTSDLRPGDRLIVPVNCYDTDRDTLPPRIRGSFDELIKDSGLSEREKFELLGLLLSAVLFGEERVYQSHISIRFPHPLAKFAKGRIGHLLAAVTHRPVVSVDARTFDFYNTPKIRSFMRALMNCQFAGVPPFVFSLRPDLALALLGGMLLPLTSGNIGWPVVLRKSCGQELPDFDQFTESMQQALLSLGLLTRRSENSLEPYGLVTKRWWVSAIQNGPAEEVPEAEYPSGAAEIYRELCHSLAIDPVDNEEITLHEQILKHLEEHNPGALDSPLGQLLQSHVIFDPIESIKPIGVRKTYDIEVAPDHDHAVVANGIVSSNSVVFGWAYGRQAPAIVIQAKEEGIEVELSEAEALINSLYTLYGKAADYLEAAASRVSEGFLCTPMGRFRRCPKSETQSKLSAYEREFKNSPIQGGVADVVNLAGRNLRRLRREKKIDFHIALQVHDAYIFLVPCSQVVRAFREVIRPAMSDLVPIVPYRLDGTQVTGVEPKHLAVDASIYFRWSVDPTPEELEAAGIDVSLLEQ